MSNALREIIDVFAKEANQEQAKAMEAYMKGQFEFFGIKSPQRALISKPFLSGRCTNMRELRDLVDDLWKEPQRELQYLAMEFLHRNRKLLTMDDIPFLEHLIKTKSWWDTVDNLASKVVGLLLLQHPEKMETTITPWIQSDDMWLRRSAIIFQLKYKDQTNETLLIRSIEPHTADQEFFIKKAIGWALRQYGKFNPDWVRNFIDTHELQPLSRKEAEKYL